MNKHLWNKIQCGFPAMPIWAAVFAVFDLTAQSNYKIIGVGEGLTQGFVTTMLQDKTGYIWIGTFDGLNRYDGYQVKRYTSSPFDPWSLNSSSLISSLYEDEDRLIWVGTHEGVMIFDPLSERFYNPCTDFPDFPKGHVANISGNNQGVVVFQLTSALNNQDFYRFRKKTDLLSKIRRKETFGQQDFEIKSLSDKSDQFLQLYGSLGDTLVLASAKDGKIYKYNSRSDQFEHFDTRAIPNNGTAESCIFWVNNSSLGYWFRCLKPDGEYIDLDCNTLPRALRLGAGKLGMYVSEGGAFFVKNDSDPFLENQFVTNLTCQNNQYFLSAFSPFTQDKISLSFGESVLVDRRGGVWIGTGGWGVIAYNMLQKPFRRIEFNQQSVSTLKPLDADILWIRLYDGNHRFLNQNTLQAVQAPWHGLSGVPRNVQELFVDSRRNYWLIEHGRSESDYNKLYTWNSTTKKFYLFPDKLPYLRGIAEKIIEDRWNNVWIGCSDGKLYRVRAGSNKLEVFDYRDALQLPGLGLRTTSMYQHTTGEIWIGTNKGLVLVQNPDKAQPEFRLFQHQPADRHTLVMNWVTCFCPDPSMQDIVWIGTRGGGMNRMNMRTHEFLDYVSETPGGLPDNVVYGILPDNKGNLWCSTNRGLCCYNRSENTFTTYQSSDGLSSTEFNTNSYAKSDDGRLWFGGINGLDVFHPDSIVLSTSAPMVTITGIQVMGLARNLDSPDELTLDYRENNVTFEFSALDFTNPKTNKFKYRLVGVNDKWGPVTNTNQINYAALPPGKYIFELLGATIESRWSDKPYRFYLTIRPPWYRTTLAYCLYLLAILGILRVVIRLREREFRIRQHAAMSELESEQLKSFDAVKNRFFANIAHELRTPLTVILGLAERIRNNNDAEETAEIAPKIIRQGQHLLELSAQLMDLARLESRQVAIRYHHGNIHGFVLQEVDSLKSIAEKKDIKLNYHTNCPDLWMDFDTTNIQKIINNLVSNAIRHSPKGAVVEVATALEPNGNFRLSVTDHGEGIRPDDLPHIFDRYYQGNHLQTQTGVSGIGLTITRELTLLMNGNIDVVSEAGKGSTFNVILPVKNRQTQGPVYSLPVLQTDDVSRSSAVVKPSGQQPLLLIVEDNEDVLDYLKRVLSTHYRILEAHDGKEGLKRVFENMPDIVIADVSMPVMDGFEMTHQLKNDVRSSHIPVVMLTARVDVSDRLKGSLRGANAYLAKPVLEEELLLVLRNLMQLRLHWQNRYQVSSSSEPFKDQQIASLFVDDIANEDKFMRQLLVIFEKNLPNETFDLAQLCKMLNMSSSQLDRKLKTLTDKSPMEMLRHFRLHKAHAMLSARPETSVSEVCFSTGFKSPAHFSRLFHKEFGYPPSQTGKHPPR